MDGNVEIAAALFILVVGVYFVGPVPVIVVAFLIYVPTLLIAWYRQERKHRGRT